MMAISKLGKSKEMRPSLIDSVDKINEVIDASNAVELNGFQWVRFLYNNSDYPFDIWACDQNDVIHLLRIKPTGLEYATITNDVYRTIWSK